MGDGFFAGQNATNGKEAGLHDGVDAATHARFAGNFVSVDDVELNVLVDHNSLHIAGQGVPNFFGSVKCVQQED